MHLPAIFELAGRALFLRRTLGTRSAAGFLRNRSVPLNAALFILLGQTNVRA